MRHIRTLTAAATTALLLLSGQAFAQAAASTSATTTTDANVSAGAKNRGAADKNHSDSTIGSATSQVKAAGGAQLKSKNSGKVRTDNNMNGSATQGGSAATGGSLGVGTNGSVGVGVGVGAGAGASVKP